MRRKPKRSILSLSIFLLVSFLLAGGVFFGCSEGSRKKEQNEQENKKIEAQEKKTSAELKIAKKVAETPLPEDKEHKKIETVSSEIPKADLRVEEGVTYSLEIDKSDFTLKLLAMGKVLHTFPIATGKNTGDKEAVGDLRTPDGSFRVEEICSASYWTHDFGDGKGEIPGAYGPWFISLETPGWTGIGIHGTHDPASIGTRASEGCIRMHNDDLRVIKKFVKVNTKVIIKE